jgi:hypothetical protein
MRNYSCDELFWFQDMGLHLSIEIYPHQALAIIYWLTKPLGRLLLFRFFSDSRDAEYIL